MGFNPCPCTSLQKSCMILAIVDAVLSMLNLGVMILALIWYIKWDDYELTRSERTVGIVIVSILIILCMLQILLAARLYLGSKTKDYRNCRIWLLITAVVTGINIGNLIINFTATDFEGASFGGSLVSIIYKIFEMCVVYQFLRELKTEREMDITYENTSQPQPPPHHMYYNPDNASHIYVTPQSQAYPMQQFSPPPVYPVQNNAYPPYPTHNHGYPAPVHHVTTTISN